MNYDLPAKGWQFSVPGQTGTRESGSACGPRSATSSLSLSAGARCTNKPNSAGRPVSQRAKCAKQSQLAGLSRQTNPIWPGQPGGWVPGRGQTCETKPIWPGPILQPGPMAPNKPNSSLGGSHRRDGTRETNPICTRPEDSVGQAGPQTRSVAFGSPTHPTRGCNCAKQTQFSARPAGRPGFVGGANVRNKANPWRGLLDLGKWWRCGKHLGTMTRHNGQGCRP